MKTKTLSMFGLSVLVMILLLGVASAALTIVPLNVPSSVNDNAGSFTGTYNVTNDNATHALDVSFSGVSFNFGSVSIPDTNIAAGTSETVTATFTLPSGYGGQTMTGTIDVSDTLNSSVNDSTPLSVSITDTSVDDDFCGVTFGELDSNVSNPGDLEIKFDKVDNKGIGSDDEWYPSDEIEIELEIQNDGDEDVDNIVVEWGLWSAETDEWVIEVDEEDEINLKDDDEETVKFTIDLYDDLDVDLDELEDGDYILYARAYGEVDDGSDTETCVYDTENVEIFVEDDLVVLNDIKLTGTTFCGNIVQITADILNIGEEDQEDVYIMIHNSDLDINERADVGDVDAFEDKKLDFEFRIPTDVEEKKYYLLLDVYDDDNDVYESEDDEESKYSVILDVSGKCQEAPKAVVYASLESGGKAGEELKIRASVTNNDDEKGTFTVSAADYTSWAELVSISPEEVTLDVGESEDIILTFTVSEDAEENQNLNIVLTNEDEESTSQPIAVTVEKGVTLPSMIKSNGYLWGIALVNLILIVVIVLVAVKATRR